MMDFACCLESVQENADNVYCFLFCDDALLIKSQEGSVDIPVIADIKTLDPMPAGARYIGELAGKACSPQT